MAVSRLPIIGEKNDIELHTDKDFDPKRPDAILLLQNDGDEQTYSSNAPANAASLNTSCEDGCHGLVLVYRLQPPSSGKAWKDRDVEGPHLIARNFFGRSFFNGPEFVELPDDHLGILFSGYDHTTNSNRLYLSVRPPGGAWNAFGPAHPLSEHPDTRFRTITPSGTAPDVYYPAPSNPVPRGTIGVWRALFDATISQQPLDFLVGLVGDTELLDARKPVADHLGVEHTTHLHSLAFHPSTPRALLVSARNSAGDGALYGVFPQGGGPNAEIQVHKVWPQARHEATFVPAKIPRWGSHLRAGTVRHPNQHTNVWFVGDSAGTIIVFTEGERQGKMSLTERARFEAPFARPSHGHFHVVERDDGPRSEVRLYYRMDDADSAGSGGLYMISASVSGGRPNIAAPVLVDQSTHGVEPVWMKRRRGWCQIGGRSPVKVTDAS